MCADTAIVKAGGAMSSMIFSGIGQKGARGCSVHPICAVSDKLTGYQDLSKAYFTIEGKKENPPQVVFVGEENRVARVTRYEKHRRLEDLE